jgi:hypothetical protein
MAVKLGATINCSYSLVGRTWTCDNHGAPSKHRVNKTSRFPCLEIDPWDVKELDLINDRMGRSFEWKHSARRKELIDKEKGMKKRGPQNTNDS